MTASAHRPTDDAQLAELIAWAAAHDHPLACRGHGTKDGWGAPVNTDLVVETTAFSDISLYEPHELVLSAGTGTPLAEVERVLAAQSQALAFEPPDLSALLGGSDPGTLGGAIACNLAGPRRISQGAARDHLLGFAGVSGRGEAFKGGGRVVKNVSGFDLCKLMAGSFGTLALLTSVTLKVVPVAEAERSVALLGLDDAAAAEAMARALGSPHEVSAAAHLPAETAADCPEATEIGGGGAVTLLRLEGPGPSVTHRAGVLRDDLAALGPTAGVHTTDSRALWRQIRDARPLATPRDHAVWRLSTPPTAGHRVVAAVARERAVRVLYDWGGGLIWLATPEDGDGGAQAIRAAIAHHGGGHATLLRGSAALRAAVPVFQPQPPALAALSARLRAQFDPKGILNPGRLSQDGGPTG